MSTVKKIPEWNVGNPLFKKADHIPAVEKPVSENAKIAARNTDPRIDIRIMKRKKDDSLYLLLSFYSHVRPNWLLEGRIEMAQNSERELDFEVGITCGAMAERLDELYGDRFDPEKSAREGAKKLAELFREWNRQSQRRD